MDEHGACEVVQTRQTVHGPSVPPQPARFRTGLRSLHLDERVECFSPSNGGEGFSLGMETLAKLQPSDPVFAS